MEPSRMSWTGRVCQRGAVGAWLLACSSADPSNLGSQGGSGPGLVIGGNNSSGAISGASANGGTSASTNVGAIALPGSSREFNHIVNLVDTGATAEVEAMLRGAAGASLPISTKLFLSYYLDEYDFLFFITDHAVTNATAAAMFAPVYRPAQRTTGDNVTIDSRKLYGSARLLGVVAGQGYGEPPLEHELSHYWAARLDKSLGFGVDAVRDYGSHWGLTGVNGQLGGFDATSLSCMNPAGAIPPNCTAETNGKFRYGVAFFYPNVNRMVNYAPLELYLMGLLSKAEVPSSFLRMDGADFSNATIDASTAKLVIEASGLSHISFSDVLALHGEVPLLAANKRAYSAAFIVVSATPASDQIMTMVATWQEVFGNYVTGTGLVRSYAERTGNRATLTTRLGRRRTAADPVPNPSAAATCSTTLQNCGTGLGCYGSTTTSCDVAGILAVGANCSQNADCVPGAGCLDQAKKCLTYCDPFDPTAPKACDTTCTVGTVTLVDSASNLLGAFCMSN